MNDSDRSDLQVLAAEVRTVSAQVARLVDREEARIRREEDWEKRMRSVERWKYSLPIGLLLGMAAVLGALAKGG